MRDFIQNISQYGKSINPNFLVIPQNAHDIIMDGYDPNETPNQDYLQAIDGLGREDLFYGYESDNKRTVQSVTREIISFLDIYEKKGVEVLVTDYASTKSKMSTSYKQNTKKGYISFAADRRELDNIPIFPAAPFNENDSDITTIADAKNFLYVLDPSNKDYFVNETNFLSSIGQTNYDLLIIDAFLDQNLILTSSQVAALKRKRNGSKRLVIAYMSIGEAEIYRYYWRHEWLSKPPVWLKGENPDWPGNYLVEYWHPEWQSIICGNDQSYLRKILDSGFDGIYLDIVDAYERFEVVEVRSMTFNVLFTKAQTAGPVRVIVGLRIEGQSNILDQSIPDLAAQSALISEVQDTLLFRMANYNISSIRKFKFIPYVAMEVDLTALEDLARNTNVISIEEDIVIEPLFEENRPLIGGTNTWNEGFNNALDVIDDIFKALDCNSVHHNRWFYWLLLLD